MQLDHHGSSVPVVSRAPILVVESDDAVRRLLMSQIERTGARCYATDDLDVALELLEADDRVRKVLVELSLAGDAVAHWVHAAREVCPQVSVIGLGGAGSQSDLLAQGVDRVMAKPWRILDLLESLAD